jgi:hypothetical protein
MIPVTTGVVKHKVMQYLLRLNTLRVRPPPTLVITVRYFHLTRRDFGGATGTRTPDPLLAKQVL